MIVDCDRCVVRGPQACGDCVVTVVLGAPPGGLDLAPGERQALGTLAEAGLVPPLRLVSGSPPTEAAGATGAGHEPGPSRASSLDGGDRERRWCGRQLLEGVP